MAGDDRLQKRELISSLFLTVLVGLAFQEMIAPVRRSVRIEGITYPTFVLAAAFVLTSLRFFIGNYLHLREVTCAHRTSGKVWLTDFLMVILQSLVIIFMGGLCSAAANRQASIKFADLLLILCAIDMVWVSLSWISGRRTKTLRREDIPFGWAALNSMMTMALVSPIWYHKDYHSKLGLSLLLFAGVLAFVVDVIVLDHYGIFDRL